ncbi:hypothetical protein CEXT_179931 [Caerostris extrusa]|uniref:Uncharacterized protein n=1 Tax=Caerostris extrusa TaxID=172846 RepID=A0AAV4PTA3_CAEEX|nr:hypothetical protein CEXT_179931 [Caerostris extrusa]
MVAFGDGGCQWYAFMGFLFGSAPHRHLSSPSTRQIPDKLAGLVLVRTACTLPRCPGTAPDGIPFLRSVVDIPGSSYLPPYPQFKA